MSKIKVNDFETIEGVFSFNVAIDRSQKTPVLIISGVLETSEIFSKLDILENERYKLSGITLQSESYGSEEDNVAYSFIAKSYEVKER